MYNLYTTGGQESFSYCRDLCGLHEKRSVDIAMALHRNSCGITLRIGSALFTIGVN
jgi:hypothetical protein